MHFFFSFQWPSGPAIVSPPRPLSPAAACSRTMGKGRKDNLESKRRKTHTPTIRTVDRLVGGYWLPYCTVRFLLPSDWHSGFFSLPTRLLPLPVRLPTYSHSVHTTLHHTASAAFSTRHQLASFSSSSSYCVLQYILTARRGEEASLAAQLNSSQRLSYVSLQLHPSEISSFLTFDVFSPCHNLQHRRSCLSFSPRFRSTFAHLSPLPRLNHQPRPPPFFLKKKTTISNLGTFDWTGWRRDRTQSGSSHVWRTPSVHPSSSVYQPGTAWN